MAQDFERNTSNAVGTSAVTLRTANSDDAIVGITIANVTTSQITVEVYINDGSNAQARGRNRHHRTVNGGPSDKFGDEIGTIAS